MEPKHKFQINSLYLLASLGAFFFASWGLLSSLLLFMPAPASMLWWMGSVLAFALALGITLLCVFEIKAKWDLITAFSLSKDQLHQKLDHEVLLEKQQRLQDQKHFEIQTKEITHHYQALLHKQQEGKDQEIQEIRRAYEVLFESSQFSKNQATSLKISLEEALEEARQSNQKYYLLEETIKQKNLTQEAPPVESSDKQLLYQLEEKTEQLNQARKQMFELEGRYVLLQKVQLDDELSDEVRNAIESLKLMAMQIGTLEEENQFLEGVISYLSVPKKSPRVKKSTKSEEQAEPAQLTF